MGDPRVAWWRVSEGSAGAARPLDDRYHAEHLLARFGRNAARRSREGRRSDLRHLICYDHPVTNGPETSEPQACELRLCGVEGGPLILSVTGAWAFAESRTSTLRGLCPFGRPLNWSEYTPLTTADVERGQVARSCEVIALNASSWGVVGRRTAPAVNCRSRCRALRVVRISTCGSRSS